MLKLFKALFFQTWSGIGRQLALWILLFSSLVTLVATGLQLTIEFNREVTGIENVLKQISLSYSDSLASSLWVTSLKDVKLQLMGISRLPDIQYLEVRDEYNKIEAKTGTLLERRILRKETPLYFQYMDDQVYVGKLITVASLEGAYQHLKDKVFIILLTQSVKTFLVSTFILFLFQMLVGRHLSTIAQRTGEIELGSDKQLLELERKPSPTSRQDELDKLVHSFNFMNQRLTTTYQDLQQSKENIRLTVESILDYAILRLDTLGAVASWNIGAERIFGYHYDEIICKPYSLFFSLKDISSGKSEQLLQKARTLGSCKEESLRVRKDGSTFNSEDLITAIYDLHGNLHGFSMVIHDISERKQAEEVKARLEAKLQLSLKMDALGHLTGGIAHDYNNMLGVILGYTELLENELDEQSKSANYLKEIRRASQRGAKLTQKLLAFTKNESSHAEKLSLNTILLNNKNMLEKTLTARIHLTFNLADDLWTVFLDSSDLDDAIFNISINAMHAMGSSGRLTFVTTNEKFNESEARMLQIIPGDYVMLKIIDTGCGMEQDVTKKIFEPFFSSKGIEGTGLGLSQVYGFIKRSHGAIKVYSELGHGTQMTLYFPRYVGEKVTHKPDDLNTISILDLSGEETILVVDDEPSLAELATEILRKHGYRVICTYSAMQALEVLEKEEVNLLLTDVIMPEMDGYQLTSIVQAKYPSIKILLASGFSDVSCADLIDNSPLSRLLNKPYTSHTLLQQIRELLK